MLKDNSMVSSPFPKLERRLGGEVLVATVFANNQKKSTLHSNLSNLAFKSFKSFFGHDHRLVHFAGWYKMTIDNYLIVLTFLAIKIYPQFFWAKR